MTSRRDFLTATIYGGAVLTASKLFPPLVNNAFGAGQSSHYQLPYHFGLGGVAIGNAFRPTSDSDAYAALEAAWNGGVRHFDTSPFYGYGLSERRFGNFLDGKKRADYVLSTKVGRIFHASEKTPENIWVEPSKFNYVYDYSASGVRRSIEDSLQRMGISRIDIVYIHDLSPDNKDLGKNWTEYFEKARKGAMPELSKMRKEGIIKGWGMGVNEIDPILKALDVADPDICLSATQYSLIKHQDSLDRLFPACDKAGVKLVIGAPLNSGFLAGVDRYNYSTDIPKEMLEKRNKLAEVCKKHEVDMRTAALQFSNAPSTVAAVIPGARNAKQMNENSASMKARIPKEFWKDLVSQKLISEKAALPT